MSPVEFLTAEFRAKQVWKVLYNGINQEKNLELLESLVTLQNVHCFVRVWVLQCPGDYSVIYFLILFLLFKCVELVKIIIYQYTHLFKIL